MSFRLLLQEPALRDIAHERNRGLSPRGIDAAQSDLTGEKRAIPAPSFQSEAGAHGAVKHVSEIGLVLLLVSGTNPFRDKGFDGKSHHFVRSVSEHLRGHAADQNDP